MEIRTEYSSPGRVRVQLEGTLDRLTTPDIRKTLLRVARKKGVDALEISFSRVDSMDTSGLAVLVEVFRVLSARNRRLYLVDLNENMRRIIHLARLDGIFGGTMN